MSAQPKAKSEMTKGQKEKAAAAERLRDEVVILMTKPLRRRINDGRSDPNCHYQNLASHTVKALVLDIAVDTYGNPDVQGDSELFAWCDVGDDPYPSFSRIRHETPADRLRRFARAVSDLHTYLAGLGMNPQGFRRELAEMIDAVAERSPHRLDSPTLPFLVVDNQA